MHNDHHNHNQHPNPHHLLSLPHHHHQQQHPLLRLRRRLHPATRLHLDPRRRRPQLPQIPPNKPPQLLPRHSYPLLRHNSRPIPNPRRPADRSHRHTRHETVRQRRASAQCVRHLPAGIFHDQQEFFRGVRVPGRHAHVERGRGPAPECGGLVCVREAESVD